MMILFSILLSFAQAMPAWTSQLTDANYEYHLDALVDEFDAFWFEENHKEWVYDMEDISEHLDQLVNLDFKMIDVDEDDLITMAEYANFIEQTRSSFKLMETMKFQLELQFGLPESIKFNWPNLDLSLKFFDDIQKYWDTNGDGVFDRNEFKYGEYTTTRFYIQQIMSLVDRNGRGLDGPDRARAFSKLLNDLVRPLGQILFGIDAAPLKQHMDWSILQRYQNRKIDTNHDGVWSASECTAAIITLLSQIDPEVLRG